LAFSDGVQRGDAGVSGAVLARHAPVLQNLAWADQGLFWDGGASDLESLILAPLTDADEMASSLPDLLARLAQDPAYLSDFEAAFDEGMTQANLMRALAQFMRSLVSWNSTYDRVMRGQAQWPLEADRGHEVFTRYCITCHPAPWFTDHRFHNMGLDATFPELFEHPERGRARISEDEADLGAYKTPSLRNVSVTAPYLHDGRLHSLRAVVERYRDGVIDGPALDPMLRGDDGAVGFPLSDDDLDALVVFLGQLVDPGFLNDPAHGAP
jgi:cytochrome c peroxidase